MCSVRSIRDLKANASRITGRSSSSAAYMRLMMLELESTRKVAEKAVARGRIEAADRRLKAIAEERASIRALLEEREKKQAPGRPEVPGPSQPQTLVY